MMLQLIAGGELTHYLSLSGVMLWFQHRRYHCLSVVYVALLTPSVELFLRGLQM
jgi:hypothetical protein